MSAPAALIIVHTGDGRTVVGRRRMDLGFLAGFTVFPGGSVQASDRALAGGDEERALRIAALRELWEETGLVLDGRRLRATPIDRDAGDVTAVYASMGLALDPGVLDEVARWVTPTFSPIRFDTLCFLLEVDGCDDPRPAQGELEDPRLARPADVLDAWRRFELLLAPPTSLSLEAIAPGTSGVHARFAALDGAAGADVRYFECTPHLRGVPLVTPTLPPAVHTNCYLVGSERLIAVDPATYDDAERHVLLTELARLESNGRRLEKIVLTHHHGDHVGSAEWLARERGVPIAAHAITRDLLAGQVEVTELLCEGDRLQLGSPAEPFPVEILFTPGHAPGHVVLVDRRPGSRAMVVGDMVASIGTIIIDPPEGDMAEYLRQLRRLRSGGPSLLFPAHGMPIADGAERLDAYVAHRLKREALVLAAVQRADTIPAMLEHAYADTPQALWPLAARSCLAHLLKLVEDGAVRRDGTRFSIA